MSDRLEKIPNILNSYEAALAIIVLSGFSLMMYLSLSLPLWYDETITANVIISFLQDGIPDLLSGYKYWRAFPYTFLSAIPVSVFGVSDLSLRLFSVLIGTITIVFVFITGKKLFDSEIGIIAAIFTAFSGWQVAWATQVRMYILLQFLYLSSIFLIYESAENYNRKKIFLLAITIIFAIFTHVTAYILPFVALSYFIYSKNIYKNKKKIKMILILVIAAIIISELFYFSYLNLLGRLTLEPRHFGIYINWMVDKIPVLTFLGVFGGYLGLKEYRKPAVLTIIAFMPVFYIYSFHIDSVNNRLIHVLLPFLAFWTSIAVRDTSKLISDRLRPKISRANILIALIIILLIGGSGFNYDYENGFRPLKDHESAFKYVENNSEEGDILVTKWTAPATYYYRSPDYSLFERDSYTLDRNKFNGTNKYSGSQILVGSEELIETIRSNERGWIVLQGNAYRPMSPKIKGNLSLMKREKTYDSLKIWSWNKSISEKFE